MESLGKFVIFQTSILEKVTHRQAILIGTLNGMSKREGYCYATNKTLSALLNCSIDSLQRDLNFLENNGFIKRLITRNENNQIVDRKIYVIDNSYTLTAELRIPSPQKSEEGSPQNCDSNKDKYINIIDSKYLDTFLQWLKYKKEIKNEYKSDESLKMLATKIMKNSNPEHFKQVVELSITNGWKGLFFDKIEKNTNTTFVIRNKATLDDD
jgi:hypothetical protein